MNIEEVTESLKEIYGDIKCERDGFISLPKEHIFAVWRISHRKAQGADGYNMYWDIQCELRIFYRDNKTVQDVKAEKSFEESLRECRALESDYEYDDNAKLYITVYTFTFEEEM